MKRWIVRGALACTTLTLASPRAHAQSAAAQELFDSAKKLTNEGKYAEACPKFEESQRLDPAPGTEFFLADCWEHIGKTASAWAAYVEVADQSKAAGQRDREKVARERATKLQAKLTRLSIVVPADAKVPGLVVKFDGNVLREPQWGVPVPVDPGQHVIEAAAPNFESWSIKADVKGEGRTTSIEVPRLDPGSGPAPGGATTTNGEKSDEDPDSEPTPSPTGPDKPTSSGSSQRTVGLVVAGLGVVGVAVGGYFGLRSMSKHKDYESHCDGKLCDQEGVDANEEAIAAGNISTIAFGVGLAALTTGIVLYVTAPSAKSSLGVGPAVGKRSGGFVVKGSF